MNVWIEANNVMIRWSCFVCRGCTEKDCAHPMVRVWDRDRFICDQCLAIGAGGIKEELGVHAAELEEHAICLRQLAAEPWSVPTMAELRSFRRALNVERFGEEGVRAMEEAEEIEGVPF